MKRIFIPIFIIFFLFIIVLVHQVLLNDYNKMMNEYNNIRNTYENENINLEICKEFELKYFTTPACNEIIMLNYLKNNKTITEKFCNTYPTELKNNLPLNLKIYFYFTFYFNNTSMISNKYLNESKQLCIDTINN